MKLYTYYRSQASFRVRIALNLKGLAHDDTFLHLEKGDQFKPEYKALNPQMVVPTLIDGEVKLFQSLAILEYLDERYPDPPLLPKDAAARAWVRGMALINIADSHPLIVPRVREYLEHEFKLDEAARTKWCQHWHTAALTALEAHLAGPATGRYCHGDTITLADICLASQAAGAKFFNVDTAQFPNFSRIANSLATIDAFARAHPLKQPGAPAAA